MEDVAVLLDVANALVEQNKPDIALMLELLDSLPLDDLDVQIQGAIYHAQMTAEAALNEGNAHATIARFAVFRVVRLLEQRVTLTVTATMS